MNLNTGSHAQLNDITFLLFVVWPENLQKCIVFWIISDGNIPTDDSNDTTDDSNVTTDASNVTTGKDVDDIDDDAASCGRLIFSLLL